MSGASARSGDAVHVNLRRASTDDTRADIARIEARNGSRQDFLNAIAADADSARAPLARVVCRGREALWIVVLST